MAIRLCLKKIIFVLAITVLAACSDEPEVYQRQVYVFGTLVDIEVVGAPAARVGPVVTRIEERFQRMHHEWHAWKPGPLVEINQAIAAGENPRVPEGIVPLIVRSKALSARSEGLFNPTIGLLLSLWGFQSDGRPSGPPPPDAEIQRLVALDPGMEDVELRDGVLYCANPAVQFDFGAFAKGYAVDIAIEELRNAGVVNAIVNAGGDLRAIGSKGDRPWRIGVRHPQGGGVLAALEVSGDEAVFTSGNYERYREHEGVHYNHILDPRTGMPVDGVTSVTVIHDNGAVADAAATALVVAGPDEWARIARRMGIGAVMLVDDGGTVYMTPAMAERALFPDGRPADVRVVPLTGADMP